jgi:hypothetical protein
VGEAHARPKVADRLHSVYGFVSFETRNEDWNSRVFSRVVAPLRGIDTARQPSTFAARGLSAHHATSVADLSQLAHGDMRSSSSHCAPANRRRRALFGLVDIRASIPEDF